MQALQALLALSLPLTAAGAAPGTASLRVPSVADVRASAVRLLDWATDTHAASPKVPAQQSGTASGHPGQVAAAVTSAVGRAAGTPPGKGRGQVPQFQYHAPSPHKFVTGPAHAGTGASFSATASKLVASATTATSDLYQNADGSYTRREYGMPVNYKNTSGAWAPINPTLVKGDGGRWQESANSLSVSFAGTADAAGLASVSDGTGGTSVSFGLSGTAAVQGTTAGASITYADALSATDVVESGTTTGLGESLVLHSADAPATWLFPLTLNGLTPVLRNQTVDLVAADGTVAADIPPATATSGPVNMNEGPSQATTQPTYALVPYDGGTALRMTLDPSWLDAPGREFPVTVDPAVNYDVNHSTYAVTWDTNPADNEDAEFLPVGYDGTDHSNAFLDVSGEVENHLPDKHITASSVNLFDVWAYQCTTAGTLSLYQVTSSWSPSDKVSYPGPSTGAVIGSETSKASSAACGNTAGQTGTGAWISIPLNSTGLNLLNEWTLGESAPDDGFAVEASTTNTGAWKQFDGTDNDNTVVPSSAGGDCTGDCLPYLEMTYSPDQQPQINQQYPPDNYNSPDLTPELIASGSDPDSWPDSLQYDFTVYTSTGTKVANSGLVSTLDWTVPKGDLSWGETYYWTVQDYDGLDYSAAPSINYFSTPVPQPLITAGLSQNTSGPGFDPATGNWTTSATDAKVSTVGPALEITRDYNSDDPRQDGAFGDGWSTVLDMEVQPGQPDSSGTTATEMVTYPDGEQVAFGLNSGGSYFPPPGRYAELRAVSGGFTLTDKNDTVYTFTQSLGAGGYGISSIADAFGHTETFGYNSSGEITTMTSASKRALHLTWTPAPASGSAALYSHVATVTTDPAGTGQSTALTWNYQYTGDALSTVCPPSSTTTCTGYSYTNGSDYSESVLDSGPSSYWRLDETSGTSAASSVLVNEGADNGTYSGATLANANSGLAGSSAKVPHLDGSSSSIKLPGSLVDQAGFMSVSLWFKTSATVQGVLFSYQADPVTDSTTTSGYTPAIYVGSDGKLNAQFWNNDVDPMTSAAAVNDGAWHQVVMTAAGNTQTLYLDGQKIGSRSGTITPTGQQNDYLGAGFLGGSWPDETHEGANGSEGYADHYVGYLSDASIWDRPLTASEVAAQYQAGTDAAKLATQVTRPSGSVYAKAAYDPLTGQVTSVTDSNGGTWGVGAPSVTGSSQEYRSAVLGAQPADYWRLNDGGTTDAVNQVNGGTAVYNDVTEGVGGPFSDSWADGFDGSSSYVSLPPGLLQSSGGEAISLWFKTSTAGGVIFSSSDSPITDSSVSGGYVAELYIGTGGDLNAEFWNGSADPMLSSGPVDDGKWHNVILTGGTGTETVYLDGQLEGKMTTAVDGGALTYAYLGVGFLGGSWPNEPHSGDGGTGYRTYFTGDLAEASFYDYQVGPNEVAALWNASQSSSGLTPVENESVTDPAGQTIKYVYDALNGGRILSETDGLGNRTSFGYNVNGFQDVVDDPDGDVTETGYDPRGNTVSTTTCQEQATQQCSTSYYSYYPDDTTADPAPDPRNDMMLTSSDGRSSSASDTTYQTSYTYNANGNVTAVTTPPVPGFASGRTTTYAYTDGKTDAGGYNGEIPPIGLQYQETTPGGAVTSTEYYQDGDVAETIDPDGEITQFSYDGVGRVTSTTVISSSYPDGQKTTYSYNADGQVVTETDPEVTDRVTGAEHIAETDTTYDADGDVLSQTVKDTAGGDAARTVSYTYDAHDLMKTYTDAAGGETQYTYDDYGDLASETDPNGNVTDDAYNADGQLLTTTLANYAGGLVGHQAAGSLTESSRSYDPAGRLASVTDAMGDVTSYGYTDDGLVAAITRTNSDGSSSYIEESDTYDAAGNLVRQVTNNGATTTDYTVDAADRVQSETLDPSGLDRQTSYTYTPDDQQQSVTSSGASGPTRSTSYTYDPGGNMTSESLTDAGAGGPVAWYPLTQTSGASVADSASGGQPATASGVTWTGSGASFSGTAGQQITAGGPTVDTTGSFTVAAWVNMAGDTSDDQTVVSQAAGTDAGFYLAYEPDGGWEFMRPQTDTGNPATVSAAAGSAASGTWTFLVGTYNANTGTMTLYVNGAAAGSGTDSTPIGSSGQLEIGCGQWDGQSGNCFDGQVADVQVYPRALSAAEVSSLHGLGQGGGDITTGSLTTSWALDQRGLPTSMTDPDGNVTDYTYDEDGRLAVTVGPPVSVETGGGSPVTARPVTTTGYDTFGETAETEDPDGNVTDYGYDADGRQDSETLPSYTPPGSSTPIDTPSASTYDGLGQLTSSTDPMGNTTTYSYDQLGDLTSETLPNTAATSYTYDADGDQVSETGPTGAVTDATYDYLGRELTSTQMERYPSAAAYTTQYAYTASSADPDGAWPSSSTSPDDAVTAYGYDAAGEETSVTDGAGNKTSYQYDDLGRPIATVNPDGTSSDTAYDMAGNPVSQTSLDTSGNPLSSTSATYDGDGDMLSSTDARGYTTAFSYDATGMLSAEVQPVSGSSSITTSFGYDGDGNRTRYTDGNGANWYYAYNSWGLPESETEPSTSQYSSAGDSTFTTAYNADEEPVTQVQPGGVTVADSYNTVGDLTGQSGTGATGTTPDRTFTYDQAGEMLSASTSNTAPANQNSNATGDTFSYDDRGLVLSASGSGGSSSYAYNGDGLATSVADAAGTTSYAYDDDGRLAALADPATGTTLAYAYNPMSQVSGISFGSGQDTESFGYDGLHRLTSQTLASASGAAVASVGYGYDADGDITSIGTSGLAGASSNSYTYDESDRLTSWDDGATTTDYGYDANGNLTQDGSKTYAYDARDELTSGGINSYSYTANGTLESEASSSGTALSAFDAYGDQAASGSQSYGYDALGRVVSDSGGGQSYAFSYAGSSSTLASDGASTYTWDPSGSSLIGVGTPGGSPADGVLALENQHEDVVGQFAAAGTSLSGSQAFDPWGTVTATSGALAGSLGFQSGWTDAVTGKVSMGARWYAPGTGSFTSRDTASVSPAPDSAAAGPFAYAADSPLGTVDLTGHRPTGPMGTMPGAATPPPPSPAPASSSPWSFVSSGWHDVTSAADTAGRVVTSAADTAGHDVASGFDDGRHALASWGDDGVAVAQSEMHDIHRTVSYAAQVAVNVAEAGVGAVRGGVRDLSTKVADAAAAGAHAVSGGVRRAVSAGGRAYRAVTTYASDGARAVVHVVGTAAHSVARAATGAVHFVKERAASIAAVAASVAVMAGCEATLGAATAGAATPACGALAGAAGAAAGYAVSAAQSGGFSWSGLGKASVTGALAGLVGAGIGGAVSGLAGGLLASGGEAAESALAGSAVDEAAAAGDGSAAAAGEPGAAAVGGGAGGGPGGGDDGGDGEGGGGSCATAGGQSFTAGTLVLLASGKAAPISSLRTGEKVLAADTRTGKDQAETVTAVLVRHDTDLYDLRVKSGGRTEVIHTTASHLFWDPYPHYWISANKLSKNEHLNTANDTTATVIGGTIPVQHDGWMWDLTVPGNNDHDFYVAASNNQNNNRLPYYGSVGTTFVLVHNDDGCLPGAGDIPRKVVNSNMGHIDEERAARAGFDTVQSAQASVRQLGESIGTDGFPEGTIPDTTRSDRVLVPFGENGYAVYQIAKNGNAVFKTILTAR